MSILPKARPRLFSLPFTDGSVSELDMSKTTHYLPGFPTPANPLGADVEFRSGLSPAKRDFKATNITRSFGILQQVFPPTRGCITIAILSTLRESVSHSDSTFKLSTLTLKFVLLRRKTLAVLDAMDASIRSREKCC